ncbi:hypothetical protein WMY93_022411 [Mugilogobius chulae]|uniref:Tumour suppressor p53-binding protein-1 Tudor domain-containing protein n=1 Tax=Mugilogobius chulae TaxID=88201 RepID=A0AAW0NCP1_9GOBI
MRIITDVYYEDGKEVNRTETENDCRMTVTRIITDVYYENGKEVNRTVTETSFRPTVTRIITDVYYEDGKEVNRTVTEESDEPVVQFQVSDVSPSRTGSSLTSGDLADISSSTCTTGTTTSSSAHDRLLPHVTGRGKNRALPAGPALDSLSSSSGPGSGLSPGPGLGPGLGPGSSPEPQNSSSFVGLRVVAKWSSNGYFYSGRIMEDFGVQAGSTGSTGSGSSPGSGPGENRFRLRFDDGYECELWARDILLCDPIPLETEVTALNQDQTFTTASLLRGAIAGAEAVVSRSSVILSLEQGNRLRERHSLGPYQPSSSSALGKAADISLDNLVEGKRKRRVAQSALNTPSRSPRGARSKPSPGPGPDPGLSPGPSLGSKRKSASDRAPAAKRGRRIQQVSVLNTSDSDPPTSSCDHAPGACDPASCDVIATHGPRPQNPALFEGFVFLLTASSERDRLRNRGEELVESGPIISRTQSLSCRAEENRPEGVQPSTGIPAAGGGGAGGGVREWRPGSSPFQSLRVLLQLKDQVQFWSELVRLGGGSVLVRDSHDQSGETPPRGGA